MSCVIAIDVSLSSDRSYAVGTGMFWAGVVVPFGVEYQPPVIGETDGSPSGRYPRHSR
jgi:hypothetical protein